MKKYKCIVCGYYYDETNGDAHQNVPAGTTFEELDETWLCPLCGADKEYFKEE